ncbi:hypothetical protein ACFFX1_43245 [Dactylosporangium sucinum]|uniref:Uncharacterized protein n=1 Tax=Dactylosporangium sucinum TaxID=1424081 RepID=A0A917TZK9_9ACTN|nr:hypothetical protein [Dactylosporangium sucinum]GGM45364.1 hypothetical protein GCM10007977_053660 [Dactylosporangium sucinum]
MNQILRRNATFLVLVALAAACAAVVWFALPHDREVKSLGIFLFKLVPFVFAIEAIARLDLELARRLHLVRILVPAAFCVFFLYFVPKIFFYLDDFPSVYYHILVLTPIIISALVLAYRLGGGGAGEVRRLGYAMLLVMLSGLEDFAFLTVNDHTEPPWNTIPAVWDWASHMTVFLGHPPTRNEAYAFIAVHVVLALFILIAPARWFERLRPRRSQPEQEPAIRA